MAALRRYCTFYVGDLYLGLDAHRVKEVVRYQKMTAVPLAPGSVRGLINLRGQIVTAIDLRLRLGLVANTVEKTTKNIVMQTDDNLVSLVVDRISDIMEINEDSLEHPPRTLAEKHRELIIGAHKLKGKLLLVLNTGKVMDVGQGPRRVLAAVGKENDNRMGE